jgi:hypothetical protein
MKILDNSDITNTAQLPIKKGTIAFLQDSHKETVISLFKAMVGSTYNVLTPYVLFGLNDSGSGLSHNISEGAIVILGEIYQVDAVAFTSASGEVPYLNFIVDQYTTDADPVTFTDLSIHDVHNIRKYEIVSATSGDIAFSTLVRPVFDIATETARAEAREDLLADAIIELRDEWTDRNVNADLTVTGGAGISKTCRIRYKQMGKTMFVSFYAEIINTTAPTGISFLIPNSAECATTLLTATPCVVLDGSTLKNGYAQITSGAKTSIEILTGALTNGATTEVYGTFTFDTL